MIYCSHQQSECADYVINQFDFTMLNLPCSIVYICFAVCGLRNRLNSYFIHMFVNFQAVHGARGKVRAVDQTLQLSLLPICN